MRTVVWDSTSEPVHGDWPRSRSIGATGYLVTVKGNGDVEAHAFSPLVDARGEQYVDRIHPTDCGTWEHLMRLYWRRRADAHQVLPGERLVRLDEGQMPDVRVELDCATGAVRFLRTANNQALRPLIQLRVADPAFYDLAIETFRGATDVRRIA